MFPTDFAALRLCVTFHIGFEAKRLRNIDFSFSSFPVFDYILAARTSIIVSRRHAIARFFTAHIHETIFPEQAMRWIDETLDDQGQRKKK